MPVSSEKINRIDYCCAQYNVKLSNEFKSLCQSVNKIYFSQNIDEINTKAQDRCFLAIISMLRLGLYEGSFSNEITHIISFWVSLKSQSVKTIKYQGKLDYINEYVSGNCSYSDFYSKLAKKSKTESITEQLKLYLEDVVVYANTLLSKISEDDENAKKLADLKVKYEKFIDKLEFVVDDTSEKANSKAKEIVDIQSDMMRMVSMYDYSNIAMYLDKIDKKLDDMMIVNPKENKVVAESPLKYEKKKYKEVILLSHSCKNCGGFRAESFAGGLRCVYCLNPVQR